MEQDDVGTKDVEPSTPRDWSRWLAERARATEQVPGSVGRPVWLSVDQARRLAMVLEGLTATVAQLEGECLRLHELRPSPSWSVTGSVTPPLETVVSRSSAYDAMATEYFEGEWIVPTADGPEPWAVVVPRTRPAPGWTWWAQGVIGESDSYEEAKAAAVKALWGRIGVAP